MSQIISNTSFSYLDQNHIAIEKLLGLRIGLGNQNHKSVRARLEEQSNYTDETKKASHHLMHILLNTPCA
jgi:hypothetical protein